MWSFAIWDEKIKILLSRDPFGENLYITHFLTTAFFCSEIKYLFSLSNKKKEKIMKRLMIFCLMVINLFITIIILF